MTSTWIRGVLAASTLLLGLSGACASEASKTTPLVYSTAHRDVKPAPLPQACTLNVVSIDDRRPNTENVSADHALLASEPIGWIRAGLDSLREYGFTVRHSDRAAPDAINLDIGLVRAYAWTSHLNLNGMVALDVGIAAMGAERRQHKFRASGGKANWAGSDSEYLATINYAFNHLLRKMAVQLNAVCAAGKDGAAK